MMTSRKNAITLGFAMGAMAKFGMSGAATVTNLFALKAVDRLANGVQVSVCLFDSQWDDRHIQHNNSPKAVQQMKTEHEHKGQAEKQHHRGKEEQWKEACQWCTGQFLAVFLFLDRSVGCQVDTFSCTFTPRSFHLAAPKLRIARA